MVSGLINVLLVEDDPGGARLVHEALSRGYRGGFELEVAGNLAAALERLRLSRIDVVLLDLSLPDSSVVETISRLHQRSPEVPIIALGGIEDEQVIQGAVRNGAEDFLVKGTFSAELLARSIRYALDRRQAREELAQARDSALESARLRAEFLANMSHEIRTPLNGIIGITRLLAETQLTVDQREMIEIASTSADALLKIVNDILDFSKLSAGKVAFEEADFDLGATVEAVMQMFAEQAQSKHVALNSFIEGDVPILLRGDASRLSQVLINLAGNAVKFTPCGETTIRVGRIDETASDATLRFTVRDTGIGIPLEGQRYIFQAFAQADGSTTRKYGGTGLGLAISAQLVELMGGNIGLQSEPGNGSVFWFTAIFRKQPAAHQALTIQARLKGVRVLVADHSPASGHLIGEHLAFWGMRCEMVCSATEAIAALRNAAMTGDRFAVALIDMQLPEMDGLAVARAIKADASIAGAYLLGIYSLGGRPDENQMKASGISAMLAKPVKQSQLFNTLTAIMAVAADGSGPPAIQPYRRRPAREIKSRVPAPLRERTRILLVEDNQVNQQVALRMIERMGYKADAVANGREALETLARLEYDVVLMDCQMPEMDGYGATREIRRREGGSRHTTIIGVTAHALAGDREDCLKAGMDDYLAKPVTPQDLVEVLDRWVLKIHRSNSDGGPGSPSVEPARTVPIVSGLPTIDDQVLARLRAFDDQGESTFVSGLIRMFLADLRLRLEEIRSASAAGNAHAVNRAAHALKGASGELGAARMRELCARLEEDTAKGSLNDTEELIRALEEEANHVRVAMEAVESVKSSGESDHLAHG
jgi:two-component system, sensor histidine kinase and response regulator